MIQSRKILVMDDARFDLDSLINSFNQHQQEGFSAFNLEKGELEVLQSLELVPVRNDGIYDGIGQQARALYNGEYAAVISDTQMPISRNYAHIYATNAGAGTVDNLVQPFEGGAQLAKMAQLAGVPVVVVSNNTSTAKDILEYRHLPGYQPVRHIELRSKSNPRSIFQAVASAIMENEKSNAAAINPRAF